MFMTFYDPREYRDMDVRDQVVMKRNLAPRKRRTARRTADQLLFVVENTDYTNGDNPIQIVS